jgi:hypothetical protein
MLLLRLFVPYLIIVVLPFLQSDRTIFKLYACEQHLRNIKNIKSQHVPRLIPRTTTVPDADAYILDIYRIIQNASGASAFLERYDVQEVVSVLRQIEGNGIQSPRNTSGTLEHTPPRFNPKAWIRVSGSHILQEKMVSNRSI